MFFSIAGTYRRHHSVDVQYRQGDSERVATGLEIRSLEPPERPEANGADAPTSR
jgi:hypothetical protein